MSSYLDKPQNGLVLGKFLPPHKGHQYLCQFAENYCRDLTILVGSLPTEPIPGKLRWEWMNDMFPNSRVSFCDEVLPQYPHEHPDFWAIWKRVIDEYVGRVDVVFASEEYGHKLAETIGARFVPVDIKRTTFNISGTRVREHPFSCWNHIPDIVKPYFAKRVCVFGPESTGKTTLARTLANYFDTVMCQEYGRVYTETFGPDVDSNDLRKIVVGHMASINSLKKFCNKIVIEDTDPVMTAVWSDMLTGKRDPWFDTFKDYADLYLLCDVDIPWIDDGTRYFKNDEDRKRFFNLCEQELINRGVKYEVIRGSYDVRQNSAIGYIRKEFQKLF